MYTCSANAKEKKLINKAKNLDQILKVGLKWTSSKFDI